MVGFEGKSLQGKILEKNPRKFSERFLEGISLKILSNIFKTLPGVSKWKEFRKKKTTESISGRNL